MQGALAGISIRSGETGEIIYQHDANTRLRPASNLKLFTAAAALETLGEAYVFETEVYTKGSQAGHALIGNMYVKGKGDPTLLENDFAAFALKMKERGIRTIRGHLIGDDSWYDAKPYSKDLIWEDEQEYYGAPISALTASPDRDFNAGAVIVKISAGKRIGNRAEITIQPKIGFMKVVNRTRTVAKEEKEEIKVKRAHGSDVITVTGKMPIQGKPLKKSISVTSPTDYVLSLFEQVLNREGINVQGETMHGKVPKQAKKIFTHESMPLSGLLVPFMKLSNNVHAEILLKEMGKVEYGQGTWKEGLKAARKHLESMGVEMESVTMRDGSGISQVNMVSANEVTQLLFRASFKDWFPVFKNSLPIAGMEDRMMGGTLRHRMKHTAASGNVAAKTGTLTGVSALSGYVKDRNGETFIFSILLNNFAEKTEVTAIQDEITLLLAEHE